MKQEKIEFDNTKLIQFIEENFKTRKAFAEFLGITPATLKRKLENKSYFTFDEMDKVLREARPEKPPSAKEATKLFFTRKKGA